ncbi:MAG: hypothetical protein ACR2IS_07025 [Nitrososphaeraceae archaeon]
MSIFERLFMSWKGIEGDQGIYFNSTSDGNNWSAQQRISGVGTNGRSSLRVQ